MTTAELIKKKEEEKNNPPQAPTTSPFKPTEGMGMEEARVLGGLPETERENAVSLYDDGVNSGNGTTISGSPINTKEYEDFMSNFKPEDFGVETEEQKQKRERADFIKQGLTGFTEGLSALANLYYTTKGAPSQKLTSQMPELSKRLYAERLERDRKLEKFRDYIRGKADKAEERAYQEDLFGKKQEAANKAADLKYKRDVALAEIKNALEMGKIDKQTAARLQLEATKAQNAQDLAKIKHGYDVALKKTASASDEKVLDSVQVGEDVYTRNTRLTDNELRTLAKYNQHNEDFISVEGGNIYTGEGGKEVFDYKNAAINAINSGNVPVEVLEQMGFKKSSSQPNDNVPPSRRGSDEDNDNVPPSRRKK